MFSTTKPRRTIANWFRTASGQRPQTERARSPRLARAAYSTVESLENRQYATVTPDPGSTFATAFNVGDVNGAVGFNDAVGPGDSTDIYKFSMPRAGMFFGRLRASSAPAEIDLIAEQIDPDGSVHDVFIDSRQATQAGDDAGFASGDLPGQFLSAGNYFLVVTARGGDTPYLVRMTTDFAGSSMSAARDTGSASDATFQDFVGDFPTPSLNDPFDFYKVKMDASGTLSAVLSLDSTQSDTFQAHVQLIRDFNGNGAIDAGDVLQTSTPDTVSGINMNLAAGTYFIRVVNDLNFSNYHLNINADYAGSTLGTQRITGPLDAGKSFHDFIDAGGDIIDQYKFSVSTARPLNLVFVQATGSSFITLFKDRNGDGAAQQDEIVLNTDAESFGNIVTSIEPGTYIAQVRAAFGKGTYQLFAEARPDGAGGTLGTAKNLGVVNGLKHQDDYVSETDAVDVYKFTASANGTISAQLGSLLGGNAELALIRDANNNGRIDPGEVLASSTQPRNHLDQLSKSITAGTYFLSVNWNDIEGTTVKYSLAFHTDFAGSTPQTARNVGTLAGTKSFDDWASGPFGGVISDTSDLYKVNLASTKTLTAKLTGSTSGQDLALQIFRDKNNNGKIDAGELVAAVDHRDSPNEQLIKSLAAGTYFVRVVGVNGETNYHLSLKA